MAAIAAALVAAGAGVASADSVSPAHPLPKMPTHAPKAPHARSLAAAATPNLAANPVFPLLGVDNDGLAWAYGPNTTGGLTSRSAAGYLPYLANDAFVDNDADGYTDGEWQWAKDGTLHYFSGENAPDKVIGGGWETYDKELSPGNLAGAQGYDIIARDKSGVLWLYLGYGDGTVTSRVKVGGGWEAYTQIAGKGDLDGDGKPDIVARDKAGDLWLYKGTGERTAPFAPRTKIGGGWNTFDTLVSTGDVDLDGRTDLIAREGDGTLWLYKGTGNAADPFQSPVKIGYGYNIYRLLTS